MSPVPAAMSQAPHAFRSDDLASAQRQRGGPKILSGDDLGVAFSAHQLPGEELRPCVCCDQPQVRARQLGVAALDLSKAQHFQRFGCRDSQRFREAAPLLNDLNGAQVRLAVEGGSLTAVPMLRQQISLG